MNIRALTCALLTAALALAGLAATPARAQTTGTSNGIPPATCVLTGTVRHCDLTAAAGSVTLPTATGTQTIPVWSYSLGGSAIGAVGPTLVANAGETLEIGLSNQLAVATALEIPGQTAAADSVGVAPGAAGTYSFAGLQPGTYLYQAGVLTPTGARQAAMGLFGALVVRPAAAGRAYDTAASAYDDEALLVYSEIDPAFNANPLGAKLQSFRPAYLLINGRAYPDTTPIATAPGHRLLLRQVNAGVHFHTTGVLGLRQTFVADDGAPLAAPLDLVARTIGAGQSVDSMVSVPAGVADGTRYPLYETGLPANGPGGGNGSGGMLVFITAGAQVVDPTPTPEPTPPPAGDAVAPLASGASVSPSRTNGATSVALAATVSDAGRGDSSIVAAEYSVDGGAPVAITGFTQAVSVTLAATIPAASVAALADGAHTIAVRAQDSAGNWSAPASATLTVDKLTPTVTNAAANPSLSAGASPVAITASASDAGRGGSNIVAARYTLDGGAPVAIAVPTPALGVSLSASVPVTGLAAGSHSVAISAQDAAGNWSTPASVSFKLDTQGPATTGTIAPTVVAPGAAVQLNASFSDTASGGSNIAGAEYAFDSGSPVALGAADGAFNSPTESAQAALSVTGLFSGTHTLNVRARDAAGNWGAVRSFSFTIDDTIFASGFETGDPNPDPDPSTNNTFGWTTTGGTASRLSLVTSGVISGTRSLRAAISGNGTPTSGYVQQSLAASQTQLRVRFALNPSLAFSTNSNATAARTIFRAVNGSSVAFTVQLHRTSTTGAYQVRAVVSRQGGTTTTSWYNLSATGASTVEVAWQQGPSAQFELSVNGVAVQTLTGLGTTGYAPNAIQLGPQGSLSGIGTTSFILFDRVKVTRSTPIGLN